MNQYCVRCRTIVAPGNTSYFCAQCQTTNAIEVLNRNRISPAVTSNTINLDGFDSLLSFIFGLFLGYCLICATWWYLRFGLMAGLSLLGGDWYMPNWSWILF